MTARWVDGLRIVERTPLFDLAGRGLAPNIIPNFVDPLGRGFVFLKRDQRERPPPVLIFDFLDDVRANVGN